MKFNIENPDLGRLGYIKVIANINDKHDRSAPTHYHWKVLKCRMILFSNSSVLACPDKNDTKQVHIIFNRAGNDYDNLNKLLLKFDLMQDGAIQPTTADTFKMCFHYTMTAKIAPVWNTLGNIYLINNRDFLTSKGPQEGITYHITSTEHSTAFELKAVKINLMQSSEVFCTGEWIRVLPSLNKAIIDEYHESLPNFTKFRSYKDIRRHWKNIHGYRLPDEECSSYYSIQFWQGEPLLYPKICVIRNFPIVTPVPNFDEKIIITRFINCLKTKMSHFLGIPLRIQNSEYENDSFIVPTNDKLAETQAVSLCTPTQRTRPTHQRKDIEE